jgi:O-acetyl-ADP-ribose deacetylase (regulator of RNase III)
LIRHRVGNLLESGLPAIAHGCNCRGVMGAGIAAQFRDRWPVMYGVYNAICETGAFHPGDAMPWEPTRAGDPYIFNLATQRETGRDARPWMIATAIGNMIRLAHYDYGISEIGIPLIGCGIGGITQDELRMCLAPYANAPVDLTVFVLPKA